MTKTITTTTGKEPTMTTKQSKALVKDIEGGTQDAIVTMILRYCVASHDGDAATKNAIQHVFSIPLKDMLTQIETDEGEQGLRRVASAAATRVKGLANTLILGESEAIFPPYLLDIEEGLQRDAAVVDYATVVDAIRLITKQSESRSKPAFQLDDDSPKKNSVVPTGKTKARFVPKQHDEFVMLNGGAVRYRRDDFIGKGVTIDKADSNKVKAPVNCTVTGIGPKAVKLHKVATPDDVVFVTRGTQDALLRRIVAQYNIPQA